jgi:hypothetical protein
MVAITFQIYFEFIFNFFALISSFKIFVDVDTVQQGVAALNHLINPVLVVLLSMALQ